MTPTWRNDNDFTVKVTNFSGEVQTVLPGESVKSYDNLLPDGFTQTDTTPIATPTYAWSALPIGANKSGEVVLGKRTTSLEIANRTGSSGECYLRFDSYTGPTAALLQPNSTITFAKADVFNKVTKVTVTSVKGSVVDVREKQ